MKPQPSPKTKRGNANRQSAEALPGRETTLRGKQILVTTDFSNESRRALPFAAALAERLGSQIALLNVLEPPLRFSGSEHLTQLQSGKAEVARVYGGLDALAEQAFKATTRVTTLARTGNPLREITKAARELGVDLIIMATHGHGGLKHAFLGSTTERVIRHAPCPVLAVRGKKAKSSASSPAAEDVKRIILATDFSKNSVKAFLFARAFADAFDAHLTVLHVVEPLHEDMLLDTTRIQREARRQAGLQLRALVQREFSSRANTIAKLRVGHPVDVITHFARNSKTDLIILSTRGRTGLPQVLIGSVAERVVRHAHCPVLVYRPDRK